MVRIVFVGIDFYVLLRKYVGSFSEAAEKIWRLT
jgi:hypothetical protein